MALRQPTATAFTRTQESWAEFVLKKIEKKIQDREALLTNLGVPVDVWDEDQELSELYEEAIFYERYAEEMRKQRDYIRANYLGGTK